MTLTIPRDFLDRFHALDAKEGEAFGTPPSRKLALLVRPTIIARTGKTLVACDWSAIEARVLPWLANSRGANRVLDIFRGNDNDPKAPDIYCIEAANTPDAQKRGLSPLDIKQMYDAKDAIGVFLRQVGKVETLALGFGGGVGAFMAMATGYGVYFEPSVAQQLVDGWRANNPWAPHFWGRHNRNESYGLWGAVCSAVANPDTIYNVGRVAYMFDKTYQGGTLFCELPGGRLLTYPRVKWEEREVEDRKTKQLVWRTQLTFKKGYGRSAMWHGKTAENITQGLAGSILRRTLVKLEYGRYEEADWWREYTDFMPVVTHTHDEIVTECEESDAGFVKRVLHGVMTEGFDWSEGLPLAAEATTNWFYSKAK